MTALDLFEIQPVLESDCREFRCGRPAVPYRLDDVAYATPLDSDVVERYVGGDYVYVPLRPVRDADCLEQAERLLLAAASTGEKVKWPDEGSKVVWCCNVGVRVWPETAGLVRPVLGGLTGLAVLSSSAVKLA